ncbi:HNH endonuclease [Azospirillum sp. CT11-132]|uniref:HNH endonuclease n=1 Tax=unclassified Azospirillum TaxID=2630922 RepID=UPI000D604F0F|nr:restriction endonuclease [Azospirillum sp. TSO5]PWC95743.1 restriction endonuclease [Azospirillum sp. TSO5]
MRLPDYPFSHKSAPAAQPDGPACPLCGRPMVPGASLNEHHLIPRTYGGRETVTMHRICHAKIHAVLTEQQLRDHYHEIDALRGHPDIAAFIRWVRRKPPEFIDGHATDRRRRKR